MPYMGGTTSSRTTITGPLHSCPPLTVQDGSYLNYQLTEFEGANIMLELRAVGLPVCPRYQLQLRVGDILKETLATAKADLEVSAEAPWRREIRALRLPEIKARIAALGCREAARGMTLKSELLDVLTAALERQQPDEAKIVARAGEVGRVVKHLYTDTNGSPRIDVSFRPRHILSVLPHQVTLGEPFFSTRDGEKRIGKGSTYQVAGGSITFRKLFGVDQGELDFFVNGGKVLAKPNTVLVPWCDAFQSFSSERQTVFSTTEKFNVHYKAKLMLELDYCDDSGDDAVADLETPAPKRLRGA